MQIPRSKIPASHEDTHSDIGVTTSSIAFFHFLYSVLFSCRSSLTRIMNTCANLNIEIISLSVTGKKNFVLFGLIKSFCYVLYKCTVVIDS